MANEIFSVIRMPIIGFLGGFLVVGGWMWAPTISNAVAGLLPDMSSVSLFDDASRLGRPETAPVVRSCIAGVLDLERDIKLEPSAGYFMLKAGSMQAKDARAIERLSDRLLNSLGNHRRYGTLVAADFGSFAPPEIMQVMRGEKASRDICKR